MAERNARPGQAFDRGTSRRDPMQKLDPNARPTGNVLLPLLAAAPATCLTGALITDVAYWQTANMQWANFSAWLLAAGLVVALFAGMVGILDFLFEARTRALGFAHEYAYGNVLAWLVAIVNSFVHSRDAWTSVVPWGLTLSALTVLILLVTSWFGWALVFRSRYAEDRT
jgi:uncharacterized membrane protein